MHRINREAEPAVAVAVSAFIRAARDGREIDFCDLRAASDVRGVPFGSDEFDRAAAIPGMPYSRSWDAYLDEETWAAADVSSPWPGTEDSNPSPSTGESVAGFLAFQISRRRTASGPF